MYGYEYFKKFLDEENFRYEDDDNMIIVKYQGVTYVAWKNETVYLQLTESFFDVDSSNYDKCLRVANELNKERFVLKITVLDDSIWCNFEFMPNESYTSSDYIQIMHVMDNNADRFIERMQKD